MLGNEKHPYVTCVTVRNVYVSHISKMSIYKELKEKFTMKNAYTDWEDYRNKLTDIVSKYAGDSLLIVGAGRCMDYDLNKLSKNFKHITLSDIDEDALEEGVKRYKDEQDKNITGDRAEIVRKIVSINGLYEADINLFCEELFAYVRAYGNKLTEAIYEEKIADMLCSLKERMLLVMNKNEGFFKEKSYDVIVCSGVYSQLLSMLSFFICSLAQSISDAGIFDGKGVAKKAEKMLSDINNELIPIINKRLINASKNVVIFGNEYFNSGGVEGAYQCISDIKNNYGAEEILLNWTFNKSDNVKYDMLIQIVKK